MPIYRKVIILVTNNPLSPKNRLLAALPADDYQRLVPHLEFIHLPVRQSLYEAEEPITYVYFLNHGIASIVNTTEDGSTVESGIVGNEGMVGIPVILGSDMTTTTAFMQVPGAGMRMKAIPLKEEFNRGGALQKLLLRYTLAIFTQVSQGGSCNRLHTLEQRLAHWLLLVSDLTQSDEFALTQEFIAQMLGVRRSGVTEAAGMFSRAEMICYRRGKISILNRKQLEATSCECYKLIKKEYSRLLN